MRKHQELILYLLNQLQQLESDHHGLVSNVRGRGLFCAYDLPTVEKRDKISELLQEEGAIILGHYHGQRRYRLLVIR